jgi:hypothetical protein
MCTDCKKKKRRCTPDHLIEELPGEESTPEPLACFLLLCRPSYSQYNSQYNSQYTCFSVQP